MEETGVFGLSETPRELSSPNGFPRAGKIIINDNGSLSRVHQRAASINFAFRVVVGRNGVERHAE